MSSATVDEVGEIRRLEEIALNSWPARWQFIDGGWIVRISEGYTGRANSITPLYVDARDGRAERAELERRVTSWEEMYRSQGLRPRFRLPSSLDHTHLIPILEERGYRPDSWTAVLLSKLKGAPSPLPSPYVVRAGEELGEWIEWFCRLNQKGEAAGAGLRAIVERIDWPNYPMLLQYSDEVIGCGLGVCQGRNLGLFNLAIDSAARRRGHGGRLVESLLSWGVASGAERVYLQVERDNSPALALYERFGFEERYGYYYLSAP